MNAFPETGWFAKNALNRGEKKPTNREKFNKNSETIRALPEITLQDEVLSFSSAIPKKQQ
ncbi:MAG TPA: hypothetical protein VMF32_05525 [Xanthobacteraceae bacterium]|nr:hypothetical protein [Xanthobacteraceae bacterium]